jgi:hypothetical protein
MKRMLATCCIVVGLFCADGVASAQIILPPGFNPRLDPLPPAPPPPPRISVPQVPQMGMLPQPNYVPAPQPSFSDRVTACLSEGAAAGFGPGKLSAFSGSCANQ